MDQPRRIQMKGHQRIPIAQVQEHRGFAFFNTLQGQLQLIGLRLRDLSKVQSVDQRMRLECGVGFRQLRTCRRTRPGRLCARISGHSISSSAQARAAHSDTTVSPSDSMLQSPPEWWIGKHVAVRQMPLPMADTNAVQPNRWRDDAVRAQYPAIFHQRMIVVLSYCRCPTDAG